MFEGRTAQELQLVNKIGTKQFVRSPVRSSKNNMAPLSEPPSINEHGPSILSELGLSAE
jgi:crotonobetainyl-CoA:carnitine CoA-transferase CaiB-like acyl-CoA transferase